MSGVDGTISYIEMGSGEPDATARFFASLFGWRFTTMKGGGGWFETPNGMVGLHGGDPGGGMVPYFRTSDVRAAAQHVRELGGEADEIADQEGFGLFCNCRDPQGMRFGFHQPG